MKPKKPSGMASMNKIAKSYKKGVKTETKVTKVQNYQTGTNPKMDRLVNARMGMQVPAGSSYTGPVKEKKTTVTYTPKAMRTVSSGTNALGKVKTTVKKGKK